ncbi:MAG: hypothetical protein KBF88_17770, partial [Polyangiaceae bacterium]|nr:hypothetical protein [Polyangiaceae bacterium]
WNKGQIGVVLMPTIQVSLLAFLGGNVLGYGMNTVTSSFTARAEQRAPMLLRATSFERSLLLADIAPEPNLSNPSAPREEILAMVRSLVESLETSVTVPPTILLRAQELGLALESDASGSLVLLRGEYRAPDDERIVPRFVVRTHWDRGWKGLVVAESPSPSDPLIGAALTTLVRSNAAALVLVSKHPKLASLDRAVEDLLRDTLKAGVLAVEHGDASEDRSELRVVGSIALPTPFLQVLSKQGIQTRWIDPKSSRTPRERTVLSLSEASCLYLSTHRESDDGKDEANAWTPLQWDGPFTQALTHHAREFTLPQPGIIVPPPAEKLRMYSALVRRLASSRELVEPNGWEVQLARALDLRWVRILEKEHLVGLGLIDAGTSTTGAIHGRHAAFFVRAGSKGDLLLETPAPLWEVGTFGATLAIGRAAEARAYLFAGQAPSDDPNGQADVRIATGALNFYQRAHEVWLEGNRNALSLQGLSSDTTMPVDLLASFGKELPELSSEPSWFRPLREGFEQSSLTVGRYDGQRASAAYGGSSDPTMAFATRFAEGRFGILWIPIALRSQFTIAESERPVIRSIEKLAPASPEAIEETVHALSQCQSDPHCKTRIEAACSLETFRERWQRYLRSRNPYELSSWAKGSVTGTGCAVRWSRDKETGTFWTIGIAKDGLFVSPFDLASDRYRLLPVNSPLTRTFPLHLGQTMLGLPSGPP